MYSTGAERDREREARVHSTAADGAHWPLLRAASQVETAGRVVSAEDKIAYFSIVCDSPSFVAAKTESVSRVCHAAGRAVVPMRSSLGFSERCASTFILAVFCIHWCNDTRCFAH